MLFREQSRQRTQRQAAGLRFRRRSRTRSPARRDGLYPETIEADVSPARLARFFSREDHGYRVLAELRAAVVFTVQDVLADPPFSRLDLVSCRNLLIYLRPEAQAKVISLFHFALREGGVLLLGSSETVGDADGRFEVDRQVGAALPTYRPRRPGRARLFAQRGDGVRIPARPGPGRAPSRQAALGDLCRRLVMEAYAPAAVLINRKHECLYSLGPTDRYLRVAPGHPTHDLLAMARAGPAHQTAVGDPASQPTRTRGSSSPAAGRIAMAMRSSFNIDVQPVPSDGEELLLICFVDEPAASDKPAGRTDAGGRFAGRRA